jgi:hypothetical protein
MALNISLSKPACGLAVQAALLLILLFGTHGLRASEPTNPIYTELIEKGVVIGEARVRLPLPTMPAGLDAVGQQRALQKIADENHPLEALTRKSVVAPFVLKISDPRTPGAGLSGSARRVDVWFIAYGDFARLTGEDFLLDQVTPDPKADQKKSDFEGHTLAEPELSSRGISAEENERLFHLSFHLFDRVYVSATSRAMLVRSEDSAIVAGTIDPRFEADQQFPNRWRPLKRDDIGRLTNGAPQPYRAAAWYLKATRLHEPAGALLIEYHLVFDEPQGWFEGANLLRSKLPLLTQDAVRRFRRKAG